MLITVSPFLTLPRSSQPLHRSKSKPFLSFFFHSRTNSFLNKIKWKNEEIWQNKETTRKIKNQRKGTKSCILRDTNICVSDRNLTQTKSKPLYISKITVRLKRKPSQSIMRHKNKLANKSNKQTNISKSNIEFILYSPSTA